MLRGPDRAELDDVLRAFGDNVKSLRTAAGFSQDQLGARCLMPHRGMSQIEGGSIVPSFPVLLWLARALGVSVETLTDELAAPGLSVSSEAVLARLAGRHGLKTSARAARHVSAAHRPVPGGLRFSLGAAQVAAGAGDQLVLGVWPAAAEGVGLDVLVEQLGGVQLWRVAGQELQLDLLGVRFDPLFDLL